MKALACAALAVALIACAAPAYADSINFSDPTITPSGADFLWSYDLTIDAFEHINTAENASFATLYDISGLAGPPMYTSNVATLTDTLSVQNVGITPTTQNPTDSPSIPNITVTYSGTAPSSTTLGVLSFLDTLSGADQADGNFSAQATNNDGTVEANTSSVPVPAPEPATLVLVATGLGGMLGVARRRRG